MEMQTKNVHISQIRAGDTIIHEGKLTTVCGNNISRSPFMGISLFGDCYSLGYRPVPKVINLKF